MNPAELRMMWMSQYNPERISLEDAATLFGHQSVGLSVMDDLTHQPTLDLNPMMSIVGGDFPGQAAAAAAALGVQPGTFIATTNANNIYGFTQVGGLHQQLLQQSAAAVFQNYTEAINDDDNVATAAASASMVGTLDDGSSGGGGLGVSPADDQVYSQLDDGGYDDNGGMSDLESKQEIINIDDFVMMNDSNSYDGTDFMTSSDKDISQSSSSDMTNILNRSGSGGGGGGNGIPDTEHDLLVPMSDGMLHHKLLGTTVPMVASMPSTSAAAAAAGGSGVVGTSSGGISNASNSGAAMRTQRKTRKIEPVNRPGLVLKTPIAYKGNIDPSVIPIKKDGMAVCERCGAIGVKHTFYTKSRRFCSMSCARGELYSLVLSNKMTDQQQQEQKQQQQQQQSQQQHIEAMAAAAAANMDNIENISVVNNVSDMQIDNQTQDPATQSDIELALRVAHIKNANYRFRITDQSKITQLNGFGEPMSLVGVGGTATSAGANDMLLTNDDNVASMNGSDDATIGDDSNATTTNADGSTTTTSIFLPATQPPKALRMFRDIFPQEDLPQIPKFERLPVPCPQMEKILSVRRRNYDPTHSYDWGTRLGKNDFYAAPVTCFPHAPGYEVWDNIGLLMKVEVENTDCDGIEGMPPGQTPTSFWVATILKISGYKALMRYEGFDDSSQDFYVNLCNAEVHSVGWCATRGKPLIPPRSIENKYKDWKDFLVERLSGARTLPSSFYNKINDSMQSRFRLGLNLECVDKDRISQVRLATVTKIVGKRLFLRYFDSDDGFWCHEDSPIIHPVGWATTVGHNLAAPQDYLERMLAGREAMIEVHEDDATIELFKMNFTFDEYFLDGKTNGFIEGMKIEAVDPLNLSSICPATVMAVLKFGYMMIRIDSYLPDASGSDWFCYHEKSPSIFPAGFCASNNIIITPPNGYTSQTFSWSRYLQDTGSIAASEHLFHRVLPDHGFEVGMSLECADLMDPRLVCVATVSRVVGRLLKIHFDGWTDEYDQWLDCESADIYPVGWCVLVNHKLEGPPRGSYSNAAAKNAPKAKVQKKRKKKNTNVTTSTIIAPARQQHDHTESVKPCTIALKTTPDLPKVCIKVELKPEHHNAAFYENNENDEEDDEDCENDGESTSHTSEQSGHPGQQHIAGGGGGPTLSTNHTIGASTTSGLRNQNIATATTSSKTTVKKTTKSPAPPTVGRKATKYIGNSSVSSSKYIPRLSDVAVIGDINEPPMELMPETWNIYDVSQFLRVNDCTAYCDTFSRSKIDGKRLLQLNETDIVPLLGHKVGPAVKIASLIKQLKCKLNPGKSRMHKTHKSSFL